MRDKPLHSTRVARRNAVSIYPALCWLFLLLASGAQAQHPLQELSIASWNIRWLNSSGYAPGQSLEGKRTDADFHTLSAYAKRIDADLIALQEVGDIKSVERLFSPDQYQVLMTEQHHSHGRQNIAVALRKHLIVTRYPDYRELSNSGGRTGLDIGIKLQPDKMMRLLVVHLKSGCYSNDQQRNPKRALTCARFAQDIAWIERWIDLRAQSGIPFVVLGDFNRRLAVSGDLALAELDDHDPASLQLSLASPSDASRCAVQRWNRQKQRWNSYLTQFKEPIDHFLLGGSAIYWQNGSVTVHPYSEQDALNFNLSDHCPIKLSLTP